MKDNLFEMLMHLFESSLGQLQDSQKKGLAKDAFTEDGMLNTDEQSFEIKHIQTAQEDSTRIFTYEEQNKLTKASYQFLKRMRLWGILNAEIFELVMNQLNFSDSYIISLEETKWTIRLVLSNFLDEDQMTFLDLVLYQKKDELIAH